MGLSVQRKKCNAGEIELLLPRLGSGSLFSVTTLIQSLTYPSLSRPLPLKCKLAKFPITLPELAPACFSSFTHSFTQLTSVGTGLGPTDLGDKGLQLPGSQLSLSSSQASFSSGVISPVPAHTLLPLPSRPSPPWLSMISYSPFNT